MSARAGVGPPTPPASTHLSAHPAPSLLLPQVLMSDVVPDGSGKFLKVKFIQRKDCAALESAYLMDEVHTRHTPLVLPLT